MVYAFWALTLIFAVFTLLLFRRETHLQNSGLENGAWTVIALFIFIQFAALSFGGRVVSLV